MLTRPKPGSKEDILLFLAGKTVEETYHYPDCGACACAQYSRERLGVSMWTALSASYFEIAEHVRTLNMLAGERPWTFGALYERCLAKWALD
jgi:hypothetical protein